MRNIGSVASTVLRLGLRLTPTALLIILISLQDRPPTVLSESTMFPGPLAALLATTTVVAVRGLAVGLGPLPPVTHVWFRPKKLDYLQKWAIFIVGVAPFPTPPPHTVPVT